MSAQRPNVVGKGPSLTREMIEVFDDIQALNGSLPAESTDKIHTGLVERSEALGKVVKMAYLKTVKAGEIAWDLKEEALKLKAAVESKDEAKALELYDAMVPELDNFINKIKTFVVRMT